MQMDEEKNTANPQTEPKETPDSPQDESPGVEIDEEAAAAPEQPQPNPQEPSDEFKRLAGDYAALTDKYLRLAAEYDNFRKRSQREREAVYPDATAAAATAFLSVADNFERALSAPCADREYKKGTELTYKSLMDAFARLGVESFGAPGDAFDPAVHNAVMHAEDDSQQTACVAEVFAKGYRIGERILRCAMVKVVN